MADESANGTSTAAATTAAPLELESLEMPEIARALAARARRGKKLFLWIAAAGLIALAVSASADIIDQQLSAAQLPHAITVQGHPINLVAVLGALFLLLALFIRNYRGTRRPDQPWYTSRDMAEKIYSLAWRYSVRAFPFEADTPPGKAEEELRRQLRDYVKSVQAERLDLPPPPSSTSARDVIPENITPSMRELRGQPEDVRRKRYATLRILAQREFYRERTQKYQRYDKWVVWALNGIKVLGVALAALFVIGAVPIELFGVTATVAAVGTSWLLLNQYTSLSTTYNMMARLMESYYESCTDPKRQWSGSEWSIFVSEVEGALSEEHIAWRSMIERFGSAGSELGH